MSYLEIDWQSKNKHQLKREREGSNISRPSPVQPSTDDNREGERKTREISIDLISSPYVVNMSMGKFNERTISSCHVHYFSSWSYIVRMNE